MTEDSGEEFIKRTDDDTTSSEVADRGRFRELILSEAKKSLFLVKPGEAESVMVEIQDAVDFWLDEIGMEIGGKVTRLETSVGEEPVVPEQDSVPATSAYDSSEIAALYEADRKLLPTIRVNDTKLFSSELVQLASKLVRLEEQGRLKPTITKLWSERQRLEGIFANASFRDFVNPENFFSEFNCQVTSQRFGIQGKREVGKISSEQNVTVYDEVLSAKANMEAPWEYEVRMRLDGSDKLVGMPVVRFGQISNSQVKLAAVQDSRIEGVSSAVAKEMLALNQARVDDYFSSLRYSLRQPVFRQWMTTLFGDSVVDQIKSQGGRSYEKLIDEMVGSFGENDVDLSVLHARILDRIRKLTDAKYDAVDSRTEGGESEVSQLRPGLYLVEEGGLSNNERYRVGFDLVKLVDNMTKITKYQRIYDLHEKRAEQRKQLGEITGIKKAGLLSLVMSFDYFRRKGIDTLRVPLYFPRRAHIGADEMVSSDTGVEHLDQHIIRQTRELIESAAKLTGARIEIDEYNEMIVHLPDSQSIWGELASRRYEKIVQLLQNTQG